MKSDQSGREQAGFAYVAVSLTISPVASSREIALILWLVIKGAAKPQVPDASR
jgi:hypothetical protein